MIGSFWEGSFRMGLSRKDGPVDMTVGNFFIVFINSEYVNLSVGYTVLWVWDLELYRVEKAGWIQTNMHGYSLCSWLWVFVCFDFLFLRFFQDNGQQPRIMNQIRSSFPKLSLYLFIAPSDGGGCSFIPGQLDLK